ncbi:MAG: hypothetical protein KGL16_11070, partial [Acidobacteriota bacterium]|nr:hypothetical protein [Acidobacteriota bacterium]
RAAGRLLAARVGTLHFPNWRSHGGWRAVGRRQDQLGDRSVTTVYYQAGATRIAYSIVSAPSLPGLKLGREPYATLPRPGRTVIVWEERNHTCMLSGAGTSSSELWQLAVATQQ